MTNRSKAQHQEFRPARQETPKFCAERRQRPSGVSRNVLRRHLKSSTDLADANDDALRWLHAVAGLRQSSRRQCPPGWCARRRRTRTSCRTSRRSSRSNIASRRRAHRCGAVVASENATRGESYAVHREIADVQRHVAADRRREAAAHLTLRRDAVGAYVTRARRHECGGVRHVRGQRKHHVIAHAAQVRRFRRPTNAILFHGAAIRTRGYPE